MANQYTKKCKEDAVRYWNEHEELGISKCTKNPGISKSALSTWGKAHSSNADEMSTRGSANFECNETKQHARPCKELRDTQDALDILKKAIGILGK